MEFKAHINTIILFHAIQINSIQFNYQQIEKV